MAAKQITRAVPVASIVLCPEELLEPNNFINSLLIRHTEKGSTFDMYPLDELHIEKYYKRLPKKAQECLSFFNDANFINQYNYFVKQFTKERSGLSIDRYLERKVTNYAYQLYLNLLINAPEISIYHRIKKAGTQNYKIEKCKLHNTTLKLSFEVVKDIDEGLLVVPKVSLNNREFNLSEVLVYRFLVVIDQNNYYYLSLNDYLTLDWLNNSNVAQYKHKPVQLLERVIQKLKEQYAVNTNNLFESEEIDALPTNCIYLSEISDTMLMLTPKWRYDGLLIDGEFVAKHSTVRQGKPYLINRNETAETTFLNNLRSLHPNFSKQSNKYFYLSFADAKKKQWFLKAYHSLIEQNTEIIGLPFLKHFRYAEYLPETEVKLLHQQKEMVELEVKIRFNKEQLKIIEVQKLLLSGQNSILLNDNTIGVFNDEWLEEYATLLKHGKVNGQTITVPRWIYLCLNEGKPNRAISASITKEWQADWLNWQNENQHLLPVPTTLKATLRPYQHKGFEWMTLLSRIGAGACLADDMGLGKTLQTIAFLCWRLTENEAARFIIVCPASLIYNWQQELQKFAPHISVLVHSGTNRNLGNFTTENRQVLICSYGTLRSDLPELNLIQWDTIVADESHNVKNLKAQITKALSQLKAACRIALSGTPVMNNTFDLYAQLNYLVPGLFGSPEFFKREYAQPIDQDGDKEKIKALQSTSGPFILRRTKEQVATDLPPKTESTLWCEMSDEQMNIYNHYKNQIRNSLFAGIASDGIEKNKLHILQAILKLRQICCSPLLLPEEQSNAPSTKLEMLVQEINSLTNNKALVFSQFKGMLHLIAAKLKELNIPYYHFDGDTPIPERQQMVNHFQEADNKVPVFLISLKSGNAGLNLTAADYVFLIDPWWNTAVQQQAIDRTHRIGQTKNVFAYKLICRNTIEEKILQLQEKKKLLSEELVGAEDGFVKQLTEDDVAFLFA